MSSNKTEIVAAPAEVLAKLDWIIIVDHSGSMATPSTRMKGKTRYEEVQEQVVLAARIAEKYDDDGLTLIHFSGKASVTDGVKADDVEEAFARFSPGGSTALHLALIEAEKKARASSKEVVVMVFTDGAADDQAAVIDAINAAGKEFGRPRIGFAFVQVGNDRGAKAFLDKLDNDLSVDVCATFSEEEAENISVEQLVTAARTE
jgi:Mg-chelatase subunit ChlD